MKHEEAEGAISHSERVRREREIWNESAIVEAQKFRYSIIAAFQNPHKRKREAKRDRFIEDRSKDGVVLDYGCLDGVETQRYLDYGAARVVGIDIADKAIRRAKLRVTDPRAEFMAADAHSLPFEDATFDLIVGRSILHHLDLEKAYREIARLLKPGGAAAFVEPLRGNPGAKVVRLLTPNARTPDERPLDARDIKLGDTIIGPGSHEFTGFVSAPVGIVISLLGGHEDHFVMGLAASCDEIAERTPLRYWGRLVFLYWHKRAA